MKVHSHKIAGSCRGQCYELFIYISNIRARERVLVKKLKNDKADSPERQPIEIKRGH